MLKSCELIVDATSWKKPTTPPRRLSSLAGTQQLYIDRLLLNIALRTRPPSAIGLRLSDYWAWLRYFPAVSKLKDLCLRPAWKDIDAHQKTILSDDWGMGFTTGILGQALGVAAWADTQHLIRVANGRVGSLKKTSKRGPKKSPDFVGITNNLEVLALECKGTQTGRGYLQSQLKSGINQKRSITFNNSLQTLGTYVGGIFIPLEDGIEYACVKFRDPEPEEPLLLDLSLDELRLAIVQSELSSHLGLAGFHELAETLEYSQVKDPLGLPSDLGRRFPGQSTRVRNGEKWAGIERLLPLRWLGEDISSGIASEGPLAARIFLGVSPLIQEAFRKESTLPKALEIIIQDSKNNEKEITNYYLPQATEPTAEEYNKEDLEYHDDDLWTESVTIETPLGVCLELSWEF